MARPLRLEFPGALYHVTSRGDGREDIYLGDTDRLRFLEILGQVCSRFQWVCHSYCLMDNHYHLLIETPAGNLSRGMRHLNGVYTQWFNKHHERVGHVFQGRYKAIIVQKDNYLLELSRYVVSNPVRAGRVQYVGEWPWSNYRAHIGVVKPPEWLEMDWLLAQFGQEKTVAINVFKQFVLEGLGQTSPWKLLKNQIYLGSEQFIKHAQKASGEGDLAEVPAAQLRPIAKPLEYYAERFSANRNRAMAEAYASGGYTMKQIGDYFGVHYVTVSRAVNQNGDK